MRVLSTIPTTFLYAGNSIKIEKKGSKWEKQIQMTGKRDPICDLLKKEKTKTEKCIQIYNTLKFSLELIDNLNLHLKSMLSPRLYLAQISYSDIF